MVSVPKLPLNARLFHCYSLVRIANTTLENIAYETGALVLSHPIRIYLVSSEFFQTIFLGREQFNNRLLEVICIDITLFINVCDASRFLTQRNFWTTTAAPLNPAPSRLESPSMELQGR